MTSTGITVPHIQGIAATVQFHRRQANRWFRYFNEGGRRVDSLYCSTEYCQHVCEWHKAEQLKLEMILDGIK